MQNFFISFLILINILQAFQNQKLRIEIAKLRPPF
jgi:hypothetical protein